MPSRFGGVGSRTAITNSDTMHAIVTRAYRAQERVRVDVHIPTTGKRLLGVPYSRATENVDALMSTNVILTRIGGRWVIL